MGLLALGAGIAVLTGAGAGIGIGIATAKGRYKNISAAGLCARRGYRYLRFRYSAPYNLYSRQQISRIKIYIRRANNA